MAVHLGKDVQVARMKHGRSHSTAIQTDRTVVETKEVNGQTQETFDEKIPHNFFFRLPIGEIVVRLYEVNLQFQRRCIRMLSAFAVQYGAERIGEGKINFRLDVAPERMTRKLGVHQGICDGDLVKRFIADTALFHKKSPPEEFYRIIGRNCEKTCVLSSFRCNFFARWGE